MALALITGASAGLGVEFARLFVHDGHDVILVARRRDQLEKIATDLKNQNTSVKVHVIDMDLGTPGAGQKLFTRTQELGLKVDYLVNNAGFGTNGEFAKLPLDKELQMIDLNVRTLVELTHLYLPNMLQQQSGGVLNVGSTAAFQPGPYMAAYFASKAFVQSFTEALHEELKGTGVACVVLAPGATATEFSSVAGTDKALLFRSGVATAAPVAATGYHALMSNCVIAIPGLKNKLGVQALRVSPRGIVRKMVARLNRV